MNFNENNKYCTNMVIISVLCNIINYHILIFNKNIIQYLIILHKQNMAPFLNKTNQIK